MIGVGTRSLEELVGEVEHRHRLIYDVTLLAVALGCNIYSRPHFLELLSDEALARVRAAYLADLTDYI